ncbi:MAG: septum formation initiator family protein [Nitrospirae bacterium]|nr:septum formation initiator family protein [Nitrospirota bacterium]
MYPQNLLRKQVVNERKKQSLVCFTVLLTFIFYLVWVLLFDENGVVRFFELKARRTEVVSEVSELQKENVKLNEEITLLKENPFYMEKHAREDMNLSRPDEYIFIFDK